MDTMSNNIFKGFIDNILKFFKKKENKYRKKQSIVDPLYGQLYDYDSYDRYININMSISKNFNMSEFAVSAAASAKGHTIVIPEDLKPNIVALVINLLQPICDATGWKDKINSGYRDDFTNNLVGGAKGSQHTKGEAADNMFYVLKNGKAEYLKPIEVLRKVIELNLDFDQMIAYPGFVHLSYTTDRKNRKQVLYNKSYKGEKL